MVLGIALLISQSIQVEPLPTFETPEQVAVFLKRLGYDFVQSKGGKLRWVGTEVPVRLWERPEDLKQGVQRVFVGMDLSIEVATSRQLPLNDHVETRSTTGALVEVSPHLGKTATISTSIDFLNGATRESVRRGLELFWREGTSFARSAGGAFVPAPPRDWSHYRFDDSLVIKAIDEISTSRLVDSWGWRWRPKGHGYGHSGPSWMVIATVRDRDTFLSGFHPGVSDPAGLTFGQTIALPKTVDGDRWSREHLKPETGWRVMSSGAGWVSVYQTIRLEKGVALGDLRKRIEALSDEVRALEISAGGEL